jgi:hypothetical protein
VVALAALVALLAAEPGDLRDQAAVSLQKGTLAYRSHDYGTAVREFENAYRLVQSTKILFNLARAYDGNRQPAEALATFERFLLDLTKEPPAVQAELAERASAAEARVKQLRQSPAGEGKRPNVAAAPPRDVQASRGPVDLSPMRLEQARAVPRQEQSFLRRYWWAVTAGVVAAGAVTAIVLAKRQSDSCPPAYNDCLF